MKKLHDLRHHPLVVRFHGSVLGRLTAALLAANMRDRALSIAGQAFIALVPLLVVLATVVSAADAQAVADWLITRFELEGPSAEAVTLLFDSPPNASGGLSILGFVILMVSVNSFARSVQLTFEIAWGLEPRGPRRLLLRLVGMLVLLGVIGGLAAVTGASQSLPGGLVTAALVQFCAAVPAWWLLSYLLLSRRVPWRALLPGAVVSAVGQVVTILAGSIYVPILIERNAERYGVIGVAVALISWLVMLSFLIVVGAVLGAQLGPILAPGSAGPSGSSHQQAATPGRGDPAERRTDAP